MSRLALDHRALSQFLAVAEAGSVRGGAAALNMSQPPLTQAIKRLEEDLGLELFARLPKGMALTPAGHALAKEARDILARLQRAERRTRRVVEEAPKIRIGFVSAALNGALQKMLRKLAHRSVDLMEMTTPEQEAALLNGCLDVGLLHPPTTTDDLAVHSLERDPFVAALPRDHPLAGRSEIAFSELAGDRFVLFPREQGPSLMSAIERLAFEAGWQLDVAAAAPRVHSQLAIIAGGVGVGLVAKGASTSMGFEGVSFAEISDTRDRLFLELAIAGDEEVFSPLID
ncbi:MAG: LysR family transcriptional regulator [Pseudomonadota bacterium]